MGINSILWNEVKRYKRKCTAVEDEKRVQKNGMAVVVLSMCYILHVFVLQREMDPRLLCPIDSGTVSRCGDWVARP